MIPPRILDPSTPNVPNASLATADPLVGKTIAPSTNPKHCLENCNNLPEPPIGHRQRGRSLIDALLDACRRVAFKPRTLSTTFDNSNMPTLTTEDGYSISFAGKKQEWAIRDPQGNSTKIWGDPHVVESDGDKWDFKDKTTFQFGNNKITVETTPDSEHPGATFTKTVTIYNGRERFSMTGIDTNDLKLDGWSFDSTAHDQALGDGTLYRLDSSASESVHWIKTES